MTSTGDGRRKPKGATWESWVDRQIRDGIERGEFENLPGKGKPLEGIGAGGVDSLRDEDWWLKAKLRRERLSYLPTTLAVRKEVEEALEAIGRASTEHVVRRIVADINQRIRDVNRRGADGPPSTVMPLDEDAVVEKWLTQRTARGA
jgi:DnaJ homologue, subfamily C, member 28, conserved domain